MTETAAGDDRRWAEVRAAIMAAGESIGGYGDVTFRMIFHRGEPRSMDVIERRKHHIFGAGLDAERGSG